jgi:hypothetical protein
MQTAKLGGYAQPNSIQPKSKIAANRYITGLQRSLSKYIKINKPDISCKLCILYYLKNTGLRTFNGT